MRKNLSVIIITKNSAATLADTLKSVQGFSDEVVIVDDFSKDQTVNIVKKFKAKIYQHKERNLGKQKAYALTLVKNNWVFCLDSDEVVSDSLKKEIQSLKISHRVVAFKIAYQNHFLNRPIHYGGENYFKVVLFNKNYAFFAPLLVHEKIEIKKGVVKKLKNKIYHYSYRSLWQIFSKFTDYGIREAEQKIKKGEKSSLRKIIFYPIHMFWTRFIKDKGYKDGLFRIPLDVGFAYMEWLTYLLLATFVILTLSETKWKNLAKRYGLRPRSFSQLSRDQDDRKGGK
jgi:glycosyltransferase involved in cell wall biosynthesis